MVRSDIITFFIVFLQLDSILTKPKDSDEQQGPCVGMDCLHGVLMHNDEAQGEKHVAEDRYLRYKGVLGTDNAKIRPLDAESQMHGVLMHNNGDTNDHDSTHGVLPEQILKLGPKDLTDVVHEGMHNKDDVHLKHSDKDGVESDTEQRGPFGEKFMHGVLMHGDANFEHTENDDERKTKTDSGSKEIGPKDAESLLHGVLMHGDSEIGKEHKHLETDGTNVNTDDNIGPNNNLHGILMHGDSKVGHDHSLDDASVGHNVFSDLSKIKYMGFDRDLLKVMDIENILSKDREEYAQWIINNPQYQDETMMGSTRAGLSDSILQDIELMKKRYLAKTNQAAKLEEEIASKKEDLYPFTADDAKAVYGDIHAEEGEDARHDLELLGSTEPLNARHKAKLIMLKSKQQK